MSKSVSDFVAASMDAVLKSTEHKALFGNQYKFASEEGCTKDHDHDDCGDTMNADDNDAKKKAKKDKEEKEKKEKDSNDALDSNKWDLIQDETSLPFEEQFPEAAAHIVEKYPNAAELIGLLEEKYPNSAKALEELTLDKKFPKTDAVLSGLDTNVAFDVAIDSLLTASAALDGVGMEKTATLSLKLASLVVEAKKKEKDDKAKAKADKEKAAKEKAKEKEKAAKEKEKKDVQAAKDKLAKEKAKAKEKADKEKAKEKAEKEKAKAKADKEKDQKKSK